MNTDLKQAAVEAAYGEYWERVKDFVNEDGWLKAKDWLGDFGNTSVYKELHGLNLECLDSHSPRYCYWFRPKCLHRIEDNAGWQRILPDGSNLPNINSKQSFWALNISEKELKGKVKLVGAHHLYRNLLDRTYTHYYPVEIPNSPIY